MTNAEALKRAKKALRTAYDESDAFDHGGLASHEIAELVRKALEAEFKTNARS